MPRGRLMPRRAATRRQLLLTPDAVTELLAPHRIMSLTSVSAASQDIAVTGGVAKAVVNIARTGTLTGRDAAAAALAELSAANSKTATVSTFVVFLPMSCILRRPPEHCCIRLQHHPARIQS